MESLVTPPAPRDPERQACSGELRALLESAIDQLPDGGREVFVLREVEGLSTADVADALSVSEDVVKAPDAGPGGTRRFPARFSSGATGVSGPGVSCACERGWAPPSYSAHPSANSIWASRSVSSNISPSSAFERSMPLIRSANLRVRRTLIRGAVRAEGR